jgi:phosphoribosylamine-glycine ligase
VDNPFKTIAVDQPLVTSLHCVTSARCSVSLGLVVMSPLAVLLIGNGGREHALLWQLCQSPQLADSSSVIYVAGANAGMLSMRANCRVEELAASTIEELVAAAREKAVSMVVVGPEAPLAAGIAGACWAGLPLAGARALLTWR